MNLYRGSDAFGQKFDNTPQKVQGFENLSCLEVDSNSSENWAEDEAEVGGGASGVPPMLAGLEGGMVSRANGCSVVGCVWGNNLFELNW